MGVNKVEYGGQTLVDLTNDSVTPDTLPEGVTAHDASGEQIVGTMIGYYSTGLAYKLDDEGTYYTVTGIGTCTDTELVIPNRYDGRPVRNIGSLAFNGCSNITSIVIPNSVTSISSLAFSNCTGLKYVLIGNSVESINMLAFYYCTGLTSIVIPNSVTSIGETVFLGCINLVSVEIGKGVTNIGRASFAHTGLTSITIPNNVTTLDGEVFGTCSNLTNVIIPKSVQSIGRVAFQECPNLTIYCEATEKPDGWDDTWNPNDRPVVWGFANDFFAVNEKIDNLPTGGGSENTILSVTVPTDYPTTMSAIITAIQDAGGDLSKLTFVTLTGYLTRNLMMSFGWRGGNYYRVECNDIGMMEKIYNKATDNSVYDVTSMRIGTFLDEGAPKEEMPQIRFTSATGTNVDGQTPNLHVDTTHPLKLTVEIVGGGALQVGDQLQVCHRKRFNGSQANGYRRKYKLQRFAEYVVTEEDLDKQYLTVSVTCEYGSTDKMLHHAHRGLFHDGRADNIAPLYLRIRRPKGNLQTNDSGQTVDAEFSNIVTIWKHTHRGYQTIRIQ